ASFASHCRTSATNPTVPVARIAAEDRRRTGGAVFGAGCSARSTSSPTKRTRGLVLHRAQRFCISHRDCAKRHERSRRVAPAWRSRSLFSSDPPRILAATERALLALRRGPLTL